LKMVCWSWSLVEGGEGVVIWFEYL
jgi:hypothetical protein